jgi:hypothetical protein
MKSKPKRSKRSKRITGKRARSRESKASISMTLTELQILAKKRGIPFGGLSKNVLIRKINQGY